ncbi:hypothetical protein D3C84_189760 [compost metagenome]
MTMQPCSAAMGAHLAETSAPAEKSAICTWLQSNSSTSLISMFLPPKRTVSPALRLEASG